MTCSLFFFFFFFFLALWRGELFMENWIKMRRTTCKDLWKVCSIQKVIFHCIYVSHILYRVFYWWAFRLLQCPGCCTVVTSAAMNTAGTLLNPWWCLNWKEVQKGGDICVCVSVCVCVCVYIYIYLIHFVFCCREKHSIVKQLYSNKINFKCVKINKCNGWRKENSQRW